MGGLKKIIIYLFILFAIPVFGQNISVSKDQYSPQELVENILINSGCISGVNVTNVVGGNFNDGDKSYGYFENNGGSFPFANGIVLSTGKLAHVPGPNTSLSDDDAPGWVGDDDLETILQTGHTVNATILEFDFIPNADNIHFRYIFASEEYRENNPTTCQYSDAFAFLIKPVGGQYENIAVIPGTDTPVKVTTVHPDIPGGCPAINEEYFGSFNGSNAPINFNGQTAILTAEANVIPGTTYHIKLVIADEKNYRYDSAVFLEGESFNISASLGPDISGLCEGETWTLEPEDIGNTPQNYTWYKVEDNGTVNFLAEGPDQSTYDIDEPGTYRLFLDYGGDCSAEGQIKVSYIDFSVLTPKTISSCLYDDDGNPVYNLPSFNNIITQGNPDFMIDGFYLSEQDAENGTDSIENPGEFHRTQIDQTIFARIVTDRGCMTTQKIILSTETQVFNPVDLYTCPEDDSFNIHFNLNLSVGKIQEEIGEYIDFLNFYSSADDAITGTNPIDGNSLATSVNELPVSVYAKIESSLGCRGIIEVRLRSLTKPIADQGYFPPAFCEGSTEPVEIFAGINGNIQSFTYEWETGETTPSILVYEPGTYQVKVTSQTIIDGETYSCSIIRDIEVVESEKPTVTYKVIGEIGNYQIEIITSGNGDYLFSFDGSDFGTQTLFDAEPGKHLIRVKDQNGCGVVQGSAYVIGFMKFFTPNEDGINDYWKLLGINHRNPQVKHVQIYDRYGKLLTVIPENGEWDGTFNGKPMPGNDYWFKIVFKNGDFYTDHFTLKR